MLVFIWDLRDLNLMTQINTGNIYNGIITGYYKGPSMYYIINILDFLAEISRTIIP